jgi:hypothetical protein
VRVEFSHPAPIVPPAVAAKIDKIWQAEIARSRPPFNGSLFSVVSHEPRLISGWRAEYKSFVAQRREPSLFDVLKVRPLAVTGLLLCPDGVIFGKRSSNVEQDKKLWELVPSGGVDGSLLRPDGSIDLGSQLLMELTEETGIEHEQIAGQPKPFVLVEDKMSHVLDAGVMLRTDLSGQNIAETFSRLASHEYTELQVIAVERLRHFAKTKGLAAVSAALLETIGYSPI